jgi:hypothetical protein
MRILVWLLAGAWFLALLFVFATYSTINGDTARWIIEMFTMSVIGLAVVEGIHRRRRPKDAEPVVSDPQPAPTDKDKESQLMFGALPAASGLLVAAEWAVVIGEMQRFGHFSKDEEELIFCLPDRKQEVL